MAKLSDDLLLGAGPIAAELYGRDNKKNRRKVYYRHEQGRLPTWKDGDEIITRRSLLEQHYSRPTSEAAE
jgi:hypothetical protein